MTYLWASADVDMTGWRSPRDLGPTAASALAEQAAAHLRRRERFTVCLHKRAPLHANRTEFRRHVRQLADTLTTSLHQRHPGLCTEHRLVPCGRFSQALQLLPADEWHPDRHKNGTTPYRVQCDASWRNADHARVGIVGAKRINVAIDLAHCATRSSGQAEFLGLCLAVLTGLGDRTPLLVHGDEETAVAEARRLYDGILPSWLHHQDNSLAQRLAIAATTAMRLRPVSIRQVPRRKVHWADVAAGHKSDHPGGLMQPKTWANRQGIRLSWYDEHRGLIRQP